MALESPGTQQDPSKQKTITKRPVKRGSLEQKLWTGEKTIKRIASIEHYGTPSGRKRDYEGGGLTRRGSKGVKP